MLDWTSVSLVKHQDGSTYICLDQEDDLSAYLEDISELRDYRVIANPMRNQYAMYQDTRPLNPEDTSWYRTHSVLTPVLSTTMPRLYGMTSLCHFATEPI